MRLRHAATDWRWLDPGELTLNSLVGVPPIEYLANWRMTLAKSALASADLPMVDIAEMAGYQSVSAFSTAFKRETGYSPTLYVRCLQEV